MKLWLLRPCETSTHWSPWYDKAFGFVIRAESEAAARKLADENAGDENYGNSITAKRHPWLEAEHSTCVVLENGGPIEVIIRDFAAA